MSKPFLASSISFSVIMSHLGVAQGNISTLRSDSVVERCIDIALSYYQMYSRCRLMHGHMKRSNLHAFTQWYVHIYVGSG